MRENSVKSVYIFEIYLLKKEGICLQNNINFYNLRSNSRKHTKFQSNVIINTEEKYEKRIRYLQNLKSGKFEFFEILLIKCVLISGVNEIIRKRRRNKCHLY